MLYVISLEYVLVSSLMNKPFCLSYLIALLYYFQGDSSDSERVQHNGNEVLKMLRKFQQKVTFIAKKSKDNDLITEVDVT